jgi:tRNA/rRNA methyltransferase
MTRPDPLRNIRIVLCGVSHPGNIGAAARAMKTMGLARLYLVSPERFPDPEAQWRAARATDVLARAKVCERLDQALAGVSLAVACSARPRELAVPQVSAREAAARMVETARAHRVALVFGNETYGLTTEEVNKCQLLATIPANVRYSSLNLAAAVQVLAYELRMASAEPVVARGKAPALAGFDELERFYAHLEELMAEIGFLNPEHPKKLMPRVRRLFARARLDKAEVNILRGILKALARPRTRRR